MKVLLKLYPRLNLGDDLFLKIICERYPQAHFFLMGNSDYVKFNSWKNLTVFVSNYKESLFSKAKRVIKRKFIPCLFEKELQKYLVNQNQEILAQVDCFVSIGGSIFIQNVKDVKLDNEIAYYNLISDELESTPKFFIGCNFGPYQSEIFYQKYNDIFRNATDICFREKYSFDLFSGLSNVRLAPDVVFGMSVQPTEKNMKTVGFSIVSPRNGIDPNSYYQKYAELIEAYQDKDYNIYLFSFCKEEGDEEAIEKITTLLKSKKGIDKVYYYGNIEEFLQKYSSIEYMYCGRFHAMILSMLYNQKIYPVVYSKKMTNVLSDINYQGDIIDMEYFSNINIPYLMFQIEKNSYNISDQKNEATKQFLGLDEYYNKTT